VKTPYLIVATALLLCALVPDMALAAVFQNATNAVMAEVVPGARTLAVIALIVVGCFCLFGNLAHHKGWLLSLVAGCIVIYNANSIIATVSSWG
jgi:type IV secretory pathway VirB2 component (pilin)